MGAVVINKSAKWLKLINNYEKVPNYVISLDKFGLSGGRRSTLLRILKAWKILTNQIFFFVIFGQIYVRTWGISAMLFLFWLLSYQRKWKWVIVDFFLTESEMDWVRWWLTVEGNRFSYTSITEGFVKGWHCTWVKLPTVTGWKKD